MKHASSCDLATLPESGWISEYPTQHITCNCVAGFHRPDDRTKMSKHQRKPVRHWDQALNSRELLHHATMSKCKITASKHSVYYNGPGVTKTNVVDLSAKNIL